MHDPADLSEEALLDLRPRLGRFFSSHGRAWAADELADEVILRILTKLRQCDVIENVVAYSLGVARFVLLEHLRGPQSKQDPLEGDVLAADVGSEDSAGQDCLERCLEELAPGARSLILRFYGEGRFGAKNKDVRKDLAGELGISIDALFLRASKLRRSLRGCVETCLVEPGGRAPIGNRGFDHSQGRT